MKTTYLYLLILASLSMSCSGFLDIAPEDKYTEDQVFSNEAAIQQALTGIYMGLADDALYGASLTQTTVEFFGQRFPAGFDNQNQTYNPFIWYSYQSDPVRENLLAIWSSGYATILKANKFVERLEGAVSQHILTKAHADILSGEAVAIRAMMHFDLLRLFAPAGQGEATAIPYHSSAEATLQPLLTVAGVIERIVADLQTASVLLESDAVRTLGVDMSADGFYTHYRNRRMNYLAARALLARVYLYGQQPEAARQTILELLPEVTRHFQWLPYDRIINDQQNPDRIFSTEVLFGLENQHLYQNYNRLFSAQLTLSQLIAPNPERLAITYERNENDYRYTTTWLNSAKGIRTFHKYADVDDPQRPWRFLQPLIRKSELYYILTETTSDPDAALAYLNEVRYHRGLPALPPGSEIALEIQKEYEKEFYGEGQVFFYYKRKGLEVIPDGSSEWEYYGPIYTFPLPDEERNAR